VSGTEALSVTQNAGVLFSGLVTQLPSSVHIAPLTDVRLIEDTTGNLINIYTVTGLPGYQGSGGTTGYSGPSGGCIDWLTGVIHGKHLMVGRTFVVPMVQGAYENNGTLTTGAVTALANAAEAMRTNNPNVPFGVWGRPRAASTRPDGTVVPALAGHFANAISSRVPDKAVVLRSRRD
jgi:hypothetical protein